MKQQSLKKYEEVDSYDNKGNDADGHVNGSFGGDSASLQLPYIRESSSTNDDSLISKIILGNEEERFIESNLLSKSEPKQMPVSTANNELEEQKKHEATRKITITIKFISLFLLYDQRLHHCSGHR